MLHLQKRKNTLLPVSRDSNLQDQTSRFLKRKRVFRKRRLVRNFQFASCAFLSVIAIQRVIFGSPTNFRHPVRQSTYPKWNSRAVSFQPINLLSIAETTLRGDYKLKTNTTWWFHKVYIILDDELWMAEVPSIQNRMIFDRARYTEPTMARAIPLMVTKRPVILLMNYDDSTFCCDDPGIDKDFGFSFLPIGTLSAPIKHDCQFTIPFPNYETIIRARKKTDFAYWGTYFWQYPWRSRHRSAVWRGSPTGNGTRLQLCKLGGRYPDLVDAKLVGDTSEWPILSTHPEWRGNRLGVRDFQNYRAVIDVDGNSWSSRFGGLLCYTAVVLKVQPENVDYFYEELVPGVHYLPVQSDFSDLLAQIEYAVADDNARAVQQIVQNANAWCARKMKLSVLEQDMANILDQYASFQSLPSRVDTAKLLAAEQFRFRRQTAATWD